MPILVDDWELAVLAELRVRVCDLAGRLDVHNDRELVRWLRARRHDVSSAEQMLRAYAAWRDRENIDRLTDPQAYQPPPVCRQFFPGGQAGRDRQGDPVWVEPIGRIDAKGLLRACSTVGLVQARTAALERLLHDINQDGARHQIVCIYDMAGFSLSLVTRPNLELFRALQHVSSSYYPEVLKALFIVHPPGYLPALLRLVTPWMEERTRAKIQVVPGGAAEIGRVLLKWIESDQLPACYGGSRCTGQPPDPTCPELICWGGRVPAGFYNHSSVAGARRPDMQRLVVKRGAMARLTFRIDQPGTWLDYEVQVERPEIGFSVWFNAAGEKARDGGGGLASVLAEHRLADQECGELLCKQAGEYEFRFDNSLSWLASKTVWYRLTTQTAIDEASITNGESDQADSLLRSLADQSGEISGKAVDVPAFNCNNRPDDDEFFDAQ